jgi:hypothetical protein
MRLRALILITSVLITSFIFGSLQAQAEDWYQGALVLKSKETLKGEVAVRYDYDVVLFRSGNELTVYPAHKVHSFYIYDDVQERNRQYVSLHLTVGAAKMHQFYEVMLDGYVSVLRREHVVWYSVHLETVDYDYYVKKDDVLTIMYKFKRKVLPELERSSTESLTTYIRKNKLSRTRLDDVIRIIDRFNQQYVNKAPLAMGGTVSYAQ